jgi:hypothetical protein
VPLERDPVATAARQAARTRRLGPDAACACCGLTDPVALTRQRRRRRLEEHHAAGRANDTGLVVVLCLNCHASISEHQRDAGLFTTDDDPTCVLERLARALASLATFADHLAGALRRWAEQLLTLVADLDRDHAAWRSLPSAA